MAGIGSVKPSRSAVIKVRNVVGTQTRIDRNASAVNPTTGAGGLYGFMPSTWHALGYSGSPQDAPVSVQNAAYAKEYARSGSSAWSPYDGC